MYGTMSDVRAALSVDALWRVGELLDVQTWPAVLDLRARHDTVEAHHAAATRAEQELAAAGLVRHGAVDDALTLAVRTVADPESQCEARIFGADGIRRVSLTRRGLDHVLVLRKDESITIETVSIDGTATLAARIAACLGPAEPADVGAVSAPTAELASRLDSCTDAGEFADTLSAIGVDRREAVVYGAAFAERHGYAEIVASEFVEGRTQQSSGSVAVYETVRGRVVASPSWSPDGQMWTTLSAGSAHRIKQAIGLLVETLPNRRWMP
ncbi:hypothetical protein GS4_23_01360 [Gordonia soli NBRC 108243]|uniref:ESX secretion-associated protein EspG n=2 Tax=Gordonia soli TaxID=320799 RepID=M0QLQ3_9ACTN|nr:hypothetical protein GS4_23_01360 [Gordonia soli NBRC 108243]